MTRIVPALGLLLTIVGCTDRGTAPTQTRPMSDKVDTATDASSVSEADIDTRKPRSWNERLGERVTLVGTAVNHKVGAFLLGDDFGIYVALPDTHWPAGVYHGGDNGELVRVTGTVTERADLPVFIPQTVSG